MSDHKFDRKYDRHAIPLDFKQRILDLMDFSATPPEVGIYDEPVRYFKANHEWCSFIFGLLAWAENVAYWQDADDELHHAIQQVLIFEEGIEGGILMTPDEFKEALCEGLECFTDKWSKRWLSGVESNFSIDEDGNVVPPGSADDPSTIPDDPATPQNEGYESRSGAVQAIRLGLDGILADLNTWYGLDATEDMTVAQAFFLFTSKYSIDGEAQITDAITFFWARRTASSSVLSSFGVALEEWMFCEGSTDAAISAYIINVINPIHRDFALNLVNGLDDNQFLTWFGKGEDIPNTAYITYDCVPIPDEEFEFDMSTSNTPNYTTNGHWKPGHRYLIEISGTFVDSDVPNVLNDGMYSLNTLTGVKTYKRMVFNCDGVATPLEAECPFQPSHNYRFTLDKVVGSDAEPCVVSADNGVFTIPNVVGTLSVKITDLGQFTV